MGVSINGATHKMDGWFVRENTMKLDNLGVPPLVEIPKLAIERFVSPNIGICHGSECCSQTSSCVKWHLHRQLHEDLTRYGTHCGWKAT